MATVMMVCGVGHHWGMLIANWGTFEAQMATESQESSVLDVERLACTLQISIPGRIGPFQEELRQAARGFVLCPEPN